YEENKHKDWSHANTGAPVLKAQHPEFEMWNQGIHARSGVACADCHMPYERVGAMKISNHHVRSPVLNLNNACQTCHKWPEEELKNRIDIIQTRTYEMRGVALDALLALIADIEKAKAAGASEAQLEAARGYQRKAQFLVDFIEAENSMGFHAPQEAARVLVRSVDYSRQGQAVLSGGTVGAAPRPLQAPNAAPANAAPQKAAAR
ncbi:MAG TPA: ammonia-forming cytochrome c nitrite reductase subunit c552, partial [Thermoanaerobaculia bacterium]|nr:ammonia-forming cytochrome c nitrite reductase subunit c552 [Thermoanaerobaculia bacterium]